MASRDKGTGYTLFGVLAGAALGSALALVYSPGTGDENRKALRDWTQKRANELQRKAQAELQTLERKAEDRIAQVRREAEQRLDTIRHSAEDGLSTIRQKAEDAADSAGSLVNRTRDEAAETAEQVEQTVERGLPEVPDSSRGLGQTGSPAL